MNFTTVIVTLVSVLLGWMLSELSQQLKIRRERSAAVGRALTELLEIQHYFKAFELVGRELQRLVGLPRAELLKGMRMLAEILPLDPSVTNGYKTAVSEIAASDPLLAFRLRSKDQIPMVLDKMRAVLGSNDSTKPLLEMMDDLMTTGSQLGLEQAVERLAKAHGWMTWVRVRRITRDKNLPRELSDFLRNSVNLVSAHPPAGSASPDSAR